MNLAFRSPNGPVRLAKTAVGIAVAAIIGSIVVGWFAYSSSRQATLDSVANQSLSVANSIVRHVEHEIAEHDVPKNERQPIFDSIAGTWSRTDHLYPNSFLCVINPSGRLALHTKNPSMRGIDVSKVIVDPHSTQPKTVLELLAAKESLATQNINFRGDSQLAGYAYMPSLDSLVVVHVPANQVAANIREATIPWSLALALIVGVFFPLSLGLIHQNYLRAQNAVKTKSTALKKSDQQFRTVFEQAAIGIARINSQTGQFLEINQRFCNMLGYSREEMSQTSVQGVTHPDERHYSEDKLTDLHAGTVREFTMEKRYIRKDGSTLWANVTVLPMWQSGEKSTTHWSIVEDITGRKHAEAGIRIRDRAIASSSQGLVISDATQNDLPIIYCNPAFERMTGYSKEEVLGRNCRFLQGDDQHQPGRAAIRKAIRSGHEITATLRNYRKDGSKFWAEIRISPVYDAHSQLTHFLGFQNDVTERLQAEEALRESESRYADLYENAPEMMLSFEPNTGTVVRCNQTTAEVLGLSKNDIKGKPIFDFLTPTSVERVQSQVLPEFNANGRVKDEELTMTCSDGTTRDIILNSTAVRNNAGKILYSRSILKDVTEQKKAELNLAESEARLRAIFESEPECVKLVDKNGTLLDMNPAGLAMIEADSLPQVINQSIYPLIKSKYHESYRAMHDRVISGENAQLEFEIVGLKGTPRWMESHATPLRNANGQIIAQLAVGRDITDRKRSDRQLRLTQFSVDTCSTMIFWIRSDGSFTYVNDAGVDHFGYTREQWLSMSVPDIDPGYPLESWREFWKNIQQAGKLTFETGILHKNGTPVPVSISTNILQFENQEFMFAFVTDISDRTVAEERIRERELQLAHVSRLSTMGEMTAGIAHEIKQPLHAVANFATASAVALRDVVGERNLETDLASELIEWNLGINKASRRASEIVERLRSFARKSGQTREPQSVVGLMRESVELMSFETRQRQVDIQIQVPDEIPNAMCDRIQIQQVLVNLLRNAYDALSETDERDRRIDLVAFQDGRQVEIQVSDNGRGLRQDIQGKIFEAFFTTKENGMGMGLAISQTIIEDHGGRLKVVSNEQGGGKFVFRLPIAVEAPTLVKEHVDDR